VSLRGRVIAALYDRVGAASERAGLAARRRHLLGHARGSVLEIGAGTGRNLEHYPDGIDELVLVEPEPAMVRKLEQRLRALGREARVVEADAETLPFPDASFDTVVCTLVLCSVPDPARALEELRRVLRDDGAFLFLEHVRSEEPETARLQDRVNPVWRFVANGCNCNRRTLSLIENALAVEEVERGDIPKAPRFVRPAVVGRALASPP
jgi:ubiquinone/menaquinone biosynthesis C-methylase UbiE